MKSSLLSNKSKNAKKYGEFKCTHPGCNAVFFIKKKLDGHMGGAHQRSIVSRTGKAICKFCGEKLDPKVNWAEWAVKQQNLICRNCKRIQNRNSYRNKMERVREERQKKKIVGGGK